MPDYVASLLTQCRALVVASPRVVLLRPCGVQADEVVYDGAGSALPNSAFDRTGVTLRTLDIVHYKCTAADRKRDLLPIEEDLWSLLCPFLKRIRGLAAQLTSDAVALESLSAGEVVDALRSTRPWSVRVAAQITEAAPTVGDREHLLFYAPQQGVFTRAFLDAPPGAASAADVLVTHPHRLQSGMPLHPPVGQILAFLLALDDRIPPQALRDALQAATRRFPAEPPALDTGTAPANAAPDSTDAAGESGNVEGVAAAVATAAGEAGDAAAGAHRVRPARARAAPPSQETGSWARAALGKRKGAAAADGGKRGTKRAAAELPARSVGLPGA